MKNNKAIVLLSGGQDSTTCLFWALREFEEVWAIGFDYGQKHAQELKQAEMIAARAGVPYKVFDLKGIFMGSSLVEHGLDVNAAHEKNPALPSSFTAGRNMVFLSVAAGYAYNVSADHIVTGVCQTDYSGYPDCRQDFINSMMSTATKALDSDVKIHTPLMRLTKAETWRLAAKLTIVDIIVEHTLTDYNGDMTKNDWGYGREDNPASVLRAKGYREAKENGWI